MKFPLLQAVLRSDLPCPRRMIVTVLLNHADQNTGRAWPSQAHIATQAGLSERAVRDHLHHLEAAGWIRIVGHIGRNNVYRVADPAEGAGVKRQDHPDDRQEPPLNPGDNRQIAPSQPADSSTRPADSAVATGSLCRLTTHEPPNNQSLLTTHMTEAGRPPQVKEEVDHSRLNGEVFEVETQALPQALKTTPDWREWRRQQAGEARTVAPPPLAPEEFHAAWQGWQAYRTRRATEARIASEAVPWDPDTAHAALRECERTAVTHGWPAVIARIDQAIAGGWQGINTSKMGPAPGPGQTSSSGSGRTACRPQPRHPAYDPATATVGKTRDQVLNF